MVGIYRIVNTATNRTYIGSSVRIERRFKTHRNELDGGKHVNQRLQRSWSKRGCNAFVFEPLLECSKDELTQREQAFIDAYFDHDVPLYNLKPSADPRTEFRYQPTPETRAKLSLAHMGNQWNVGRKLPEEQKAKISAGNMGHIVSPETRAKIGASNSVKVRSEELRARIRASLLGRTLTPEHRANIGAGGKGVRRSPETRARMRAAWIIRKQKTDGAI